ncbi:hypothetical protein [Salinicoccus halodurans]|uniref:Uncharacterized protein n=1 Tax=Salinicoccus halodurans TaxID=407035 RepID=A0A0F7HI04_9STAP|nr:hypothetical protein [Salinicoccus halodurans]AKG72897.1 hypothetical protein AAT16_00865 [Salinicoccus halodurans]SFK75753.1 hypothetical protein SAMN05216235_1541 [Salinicoccus halodurans]
MKIFSFFVITPIIIFFLLLFITDPANAVGGVFIYYLVMLASRSYDRYRRKKAKKDQNRKN